MSYNIACHTFSYLRTYSLAGAKNRKPIQENPVWKCSPRLFPKVEQEYHN